MALASVIAIAPEHLRSTDEPRAAEPATVAPGRVGAPGQVSMPCVVSILSDLDPFDNEEDFVDSFCRLAVACARPGQVEMTGAPYLPAPGPHVAPPDRLLVRYEAEPALAPGEQRAVFLERASETEAIPGILEVKGSEGLSAISLGGVVRSAW